MAGRKSPWGGGNDGGDEPASAGPGQADGGSDSGGDPGGDRPDNDGPPADTPADKPKGPRNPWLPPSGAAPPRRSAGMEDILRPGTKRGGGGGGGGWGSGPGFPKLPERANGKSWVPLIIGGLLVAWLLFSTTHMLGPKEQGIITTFGKYSRTVGSGLSLTAPWPIESVRIEDVTSIKRENIPEADGEKLMLTSDQNLVDISYIVRWNIKDLKLFTFQLDDPNDTVKEVAEAAMRASVAEVPLKDAMGGSGRDFIQRSVSARMQSILDAYHSGILIQGVDIKKANPPAKVNDAFQKVSAAQQDANKDISNAQAWAQQVIARAQGDAAEFDKVYAQYKLAPEVTKRRLYYETMERVLANNETVVVESNGVQSYLPLSEVRRMTAPTPAPSAPTPSQGGQ